MDRFTGWQYMLIDLCNHFGGDKWLFQDRIKWAEDNLKNLEALASQAENYPLYMKGLMAMRKVQAGEPTGHMVGFDACCSGIQVMSALTGCIAGATATGLVDPQRRADAYTDLSGIMQSILGPGFHVIRSDAKNALMTVFYGSKEQPKLIFGEDTPELNAFYEAAVKLAPGAWGLLQDLLASWQPNALVHRWVLPDGFDARVKVMTQKEIRIEVDELAGCTFTYEFYENVGQKRGLSNVANVVHSVDAYILRCIHRRCNYDEVVVHAARRAIQEVLHTCALYGIEANGIAPVGSKLAYYENQYIRSGIADVVILPYIQSYADAECLELDHLRKLLAIVESMVVHTPFEVVTIH